MSARRYLGCLGEQNLETPFLAAVSVGNPFNLVGLSYLLKYHSLTAQFALLGDMKRKIRQNNEVLSR